MDMSTLQKRPLLQQLFVLLAGIAVNFILSGIAWGTLFGTLNLVLAIGNLSAISRWMEERHGDLPARLQSIIPLVEWVPSLPAFRLAWLGLVPFQPLTGTVYGHNS
jgi:hypothetical protein